MKRKPRAATVILIPKENNRIYGDDVPMPWKEAARETGIPARTFEWLMSSRQIASLKVGRRVMIRPSAVQAYLKLRETRAI